MGQPVGGRKGRAPLPAKTQYSKSLSGTGVLNVLWFPRGSLSPLRPPAQVTPEPALLPEGV